MKCFTFSMPFFVICLSIKLNLLNRKILILCLVLLMSVGNLLAQNNSSFIWSANYGGEEDDYPSKVLPLADNGYLIVGYSESTSGDKQDSKGKSDIWVIKTTASGAIEWEESYGSTGNDYTYAALENSAGNFVIAGYTWGDDGDVDMNKGLADVWVIQLDPSGEIMWQKTYGGSSSEIMNTIIETSDGGYALVGSTNSDNGDISMSFDSRDVWLLKLDNQGDMIWEQTYGGNKWDEAYSILEDEEGNFVIAAESGSSDEDVSTPNKGLLDIWLFKTDATGTLLWEKSYGSTDNEGEPYLLAGDDGGYFIFARTFGEDMDVSLNYGRWDMWLIKTNAEGELMWQRSYGGSHHDYPLAVAKGPYGSLVVGAYSESENGHVSGNHGKVDVWLLGLSQDGVILWEEHFGGTESEWPLAITITDQQTALVASFSKSDDQDVSTNEGKGDIWLFEKSLVATGLEDQLAETIQIYPNPSSTHFVIESEHPLQVEIYNVLGHRVLSIPNYQLQHRIDMHTLPQGVYMVEVEDDKVVKGYYKVVRE